MLRKKVLFMVFATILIVLTGCGSGSETSSGSNANGAENGSENQGEERPQYTFRLAETHPADYPTTLGDKKFAELVSERTDGRITIEVFPSAQLGEEKAAIEQVQLGSIDFTRVSTGPLAEFNDEYGVFSLPYIFDNDEHVWNFLRGPKGRELLSSIESSNMKGLAYYSSGSRSFYSTEPLESIDDIEGKKIRVIQNKLNIDVVEALGGNASPMAYGEVFSALQSGVIDAAENNYPSYYSSKHYEVAPYMIRDSHQRVPEVLLVSKVTWDKLSPEDQEIIEQAALDSVKTQKEEWAKYAKESKEKVLEAGVTITEVEDITPWQEAVQPVIEEHGEKYADILEAIDEARP